jgi:RHS repeat-associated protein
LGTGEEILTVTYYDNYDFDSLNLITNFSSTINFEGNDPNSLVNYAVKGLVTGSLVKVLGEEKYLMTATYYDDKYRIIREFRENIFGGNEVTLNKYDFIGNILRSKHVIYKFHNTHSPVIINRWNDYDHANRPRDIYHEIVGKDPVHMAKMSYNELGQIKTKQLHETSNGEYLQDIDYTYNIRGWLTDINDPETTSDDLFALSLQYNDTTGVRSLGALPMYNGNISGMRWRQDTVRGYGFQYDRLNRLTASVYGQGPGLDQLKGKYNESVESYDLNGNILQLHRAGEENGTDYSNYDNLEYSYIGNMLMSVRDQGIDTIGFIDGYDSETIPDYTYDSNGNLKKDLNKGITDIKYNYLNLPSEVIKDATHKVMYTYDATGVKLKKRLMNSMDTITDIYYSGICEYIDTNLVLIQFDEGVINVADGIYNYEYFLKDHLGNIRASFEPEGNGLTPMQTVDYYPFGMLSLKRANSSNNRYLYNGKELQEDNFGGVSLEWYDYGARFYDPQIGRWHVMDPKGEQYYSNSPYHFCANNPLIFVDPDGQSYYYGSDGSFLFETCDDKDDVYYWNKDKENKRQNEDGENETYYGGFDALQRNGNTVQNGDLMLLASTAYGESSEKNVSNEVYGIASAIVNNMDLRKNGTIQGTIKGFAFAATDGNKRTNKFNNTSEGGRNGTFMQTAIGGAINALSGGIDYSNGATHWAGTDIASSTEKRATGGLLFSDQSHDMFCLGSQTANGAPVKGYNRDGSYRGTYSYTWQTTAAFGGTTFMKKTDKFIIATGAPRY